MDDVKILITNLEGEVVSDDNQYTNYSFDSNYSAAVDAFNATLVDNDADIKKGYGIQFLVNNKIEFDGVIQRPQKTGNKSQRTISISGKDRASILVESYCNDFKDFNNKKPTDIIDSLIGQTNFYVKSKVSVPEIEDDTGFNSTDDIESINEARLDEAQNSKTQAKRSNETFYDQDFSKIANKVHFKIEIGDMVYSKISQLVTSLGYEILYENSGLLYIGDLNKKRYDDEITYNIKLLKSGIGNNVESWDFTEDDSGRYSKIQISSVTQNFLGKRVSSAVATDSTMTTEKYYAKKINDSDESPKNMAIRIREDQRINGFQLRYVVPGHSADNGETWKLNRYINVEDEINDSRQHLVLYSRTFVFDESNGQQTVLNLSKERLMELNI